MCIALLGYNRAVDSLTIRKPDDWHTHFRDGAMLSAVAPFTARAFGRAIVMPNLSPKPVITTEDARAYLERVRKATSAFPSFTPLMTLYMSESMDPEDVVLGFREGVVNAVKVYPANATTNSAQGVTDIKNVFPVLEKMQEVGMPVLLHGETVLKDGEEVPAMDREKVYLDTTLPMLLKNFPALKIVLEHATTKDAVDFVLNENSPRLASTLTLHHLMAANDGPNPDSAFLKCMPVIKSPEDRAALRRAAASGDSHFFLGTDSAPHTLSAKLGANPPAGVFTSPAAVELYAQVFEEENALENFEKFASLNGPAFYGMNPNTETITLKKETWTLDSDVAVEGGDSIRPFGYDEDPAMRLPIRWKIK